MAKKTKKATKKAASRLSEQSGGAEERHEPPVDATAATAHSRSLPDPRVRAEDVEVLRSAIEGLSALLNRRLDDQQRTLEQLQQAAAVSAPAQPSPYEDNAMARLLATTSDLRERLARIEAGMGETQRRVTLMEENQRPPAPALDREAAARTAAFRWMLANQCRASNLTRPTAAIVGRVMHDERAFDERTSKSPQELFLGILSTVRSVFRLAVPRPDQEAAPGQNYVHLTDDIAAIFEERSTRPKKKHSNYFNEQLDPRLAVLVNSGLARKERIPRERIPHYFRYLTPMGREVFGGWPEWDDRTGGISLVDEQMLPDPNAAGRPVIGATATLETQPASPPQPSPPPPSSVPPAT
jgi:hypothetical protein